MYINKIDKLIDKIIDDFYNNIIVDNKEFSKIKVDSNFVRYQSKINDILVEYFKSINYDDINKLFTNMESVNKIINILRRYVSYYIFLIFGYYYEEKDDIYINNIIEFSKNQSTFNFKVNNFFNSENNSNIIKYFKLLRNIIKVLQINDKEKLKMFSEKEEYKQTFDFLNKLGKKFVEENFKLENKNNQAHNIIKTIIISDLYNNIEKKDIYKIIQANEKQDGEFTFIDILVSRDTYIDYTNVENLLTQTEINNGYADNIYNFLKEHKHNLPKLSDIDGKILQLINNNLIVPVVEDFMLYHKDTEKYDKGRKYDDNYKKKKEETKIKYIINKLDSVTEYYNKLNKKKHITEQFFYPPLKYRKAVLFNNYEDLSIIKKISIQKGQSITYNENYNDLKYYRLYPYINFKDISKSGFSIELDKTIDIIRRTTFDKSIDKNSYLQLRIGSNNQIINITGLVIPTRTLLLQKMKIKNIYDIRSINRDEKYNNGYYGTIRFLIHSLFKSRNHKSSVYWDFDINRDMTKIDEYYRENNKKYNDIKFIIAKLYDEILEQIYHFISDEYKGRKYVSLYESKQLIQRIEKLILGED